MTREQYKVSALEIITLIKWNELEPRRLEIKGKHYVAVRIYIGGPAANSIPRCLLENFKDFYKKYVDEQLTYEGYMYDGFYRVINKMRTETIGLDLFVYFPTVEWPEDICKMDQ